jgi:hypothetical protein
VRGVDMKVVRGVGGCENGEGCRQRGVQNQWSADPTARESTTSEPTVSSLKA